MTEDESGIVEAMWGLIYSQEEGITLIGSRVASGDISAESGDAIIAMLGDSNKHLRAYLWMREHGEVECE